MQCGHADPAPSSCPRPRLTHAMRLTVPSSHAAEIAYKAGQAADGVSYLSVMQMGSFGMDRYRWSFRIGGVNAYNVPRFHQMVYYTLVAEYAHMFVATSPLTHSHADYIPQRTGHSPVASIQHGYMALEERYWSVREAHSQQEEVPESKCEAGRGACQW